jgi:hypothetical protein
MLDHRGMRSRAIVTRLAELLPAETDPWSRELALVQRAADPQPPAKRRLELVPQAKDDGLLRSRALRHREILKTALTLS